MIHLRCASAYEGGITASRTTSQRCYESNRDSSQTDYFNEIVMPPGTSPLHFPLTVHAAVPILEVDGLASMPTTGIQGLDIRLGQHRSTQRKVP